eukprot:COSAG04_NODE_62_length_30099_cov_4.276633_28_plen_96_part_00
MKHNVVDYLSCVTCPLVVRQSTNVRDGISQRKIDCPGPSFFRLIYEIYWLGQCVTHITWIIYPSRLSVLVELRIIRFTDDAKTWNYDPQGGAIRL